MTTKQKLAALLPGVAIGLAILVATDPGPTVHGLALTGIVSGGPTANKAVVDSAGSLQTAITYPTGAACYIANAGGLATTAAYSVSIESPSAARVTIERVCVGLSNATAAAAATVTVQRRTTASSGGTAMSAEATASQAVSKLDPADANFGGVARLTGTLGTPGALLDQWGIMVGELGAGASDPQFVPVCKVYGGSIGQKPIIVAAGVANGVSVNVSAPGAGGLASGSISVEFCVR